MFGIFVDGKNKPYPISECRHKLAGYAIVAGVLLGDGTQPIRRRALVPATAVAGFDGKALGYHLKTTAFWEEDPVRLAGHKG